MRDRLNVIVALSVYGFALMIRAATDALDAVPVSATTASTAMGFGWARRFFTVELPLSGPGCWLGCEWCR